MFFRKGEKKKGEWGVGCDCFCIRMRFKETEGGNYGKMIGVAVDEVMKWWSVEEVGFEESWVLRKVGLEMAQVMWPTVYQKIQMGGSDFECWVSFLYDLGRHKHGVPFQCVDTLSLPLFPSSPLPLFSLPFVVSHPLLYPFSFPLSLYFFILCDFKTLKLTHSPSLSFCWLNSKPKTKLTVLQTRITNQSPIITFFYHSLSFIILAFPLHSSLFSFYEWSI